MFDIALHDGKAKTLGVPIYKILGAARNSIRAYASCPLLANDRAYVDFCQNRVARGDRAIKIHPYGQVEDDIRLVRRLTDSFFGQSVRWNLDAEGAYSPAQALRMGRLLDTLEWEFFEAPMPDSDLIRYKALADAVDIDVLSSRNSIPDLHRIQLALQMRAWDRTRFDVTGIGGFTGGCEAMAVTRAHRLKGELKSWGYTLTQAANLHLLLSQPNCDYFGPSRSFDLISLGKCGQTICRALASRWIGKCLSLLATKAVNSNSSHSTVFTQNPIISTPN
jgi:L-alanine-DL-glutamate epimerase-like enolase superfamily enzyme